MRLMARSAYGDDLDLSVGYDSSAATDYGAARSLLFAGTILGLIGVANVVQGIAVLAGSRVYPDNAVFVFAHQHTWGWIVLAVGAVTVLVSFAIFTRSTFARSFGVAVAVGNAFSQLLVMPARPLWALAALAADLLVVKALVAHGGSAPLA
jgi:hypothetical protein